jgi:GTP cyclohydrolase II
LHSLEISRVKLLTNNPEKLQTLIDAGIQAQAESLPGQINDFNAKYIKTKQERLGHK